MFKLIFKNLWARRRRNAWIVIELVLITIVAWVVLDPAMVTGYYFTLDPGYDIERLVSIHIAEIPEGGRGYDAANSGRENNMENVRRLLDRVRTDSRVEAATIGMSEGFESHNSNVNSFPNVSADGVYFHVKFLPNTDFFKTFGIKGLDGEIFKEPAVSGNDIIISRSVAQVMHPGVANPVGHYLNEMTDSTYNWDRNKLIAGVVEDALYRSTMGRSPIVYRYEKDRKIKDISQVKLVLRLKSGVNPNRFIEEYSPVIANELKAGNVYAHSPELYTDIRDNMARDSHNKYVISLALAAFFFVNLCLGIIGTFYLQTRTRSRDTGIMRSFGATPRKILLEIMSEGWIMTTISWILGCGIYYMYVRKIGLAKPEGTGWGESETIKEVMPQWIDFFWTHFSVVSLFIYVVLMITVSIGIYIPARRISSANPVDALKDE